MSHSSLSRGSDIDTLCRALLNTIGAVLFFVYPYLKFFTHWAQLECAALIAAVAPVAWAACAAFDNSAGTQDFGALWTSSLNIVQADWRPILAIFAFECAFSFFHEIVYGCQVRITH
jgi:4-hydroxybenzoate polyprenyltransferase